MTWMWIVGAVAIYVFVVWQLGRWLHLCDSDAESWSHVMPETIVDELRKLRCGACGGKIDRVNLVSVGRPAKWPYPTAGNVMTGEKGEAVAVCCDHCAETGRPVVEVIELDKGQAFYHRIDELPPF
jgi:hypothetical protein